MTTTTFNPETLSHPKFERQVELEAEMRNAGIQRFRDAVRKAEEKGQYSATRAGMRLVTAAHQKMVEAVETFIAEAKSGKAGPKHTALKYVTRLDVDTVANITARAVLDEIARKSTLTKVAMGIGMLMESEVNARIFEEQMPRAYAKFHEKASKENLEKRKWAHLLYPAKLLGVELEEWSDRDRILVGTKLVELFVGATGLVDINLVSSEKTGTLYMVEPNASTLEWLKEENSRLEALSPVYMPTIIPPKPWTNPSSGGYYTNVVRQLTLVKSYNRGYHEELASRPMAEVYAAVNALQNTAWQINKPVLEVMETLYDADGGLAGLPKADLIPLPPKPWWLPEGERVAREDMSEEQLAEFKAWKAAAHRTYQENAMMQRQRALFFRTLSVAKRFREEEEFFYPHQLDWRGRAYPIPLYLQPQGNDMQRGLLTFASSVPINDEEDASWLAIHGAGCWGYDKVSLEERVQWVLENEEQILASAENPYDNRFWMDADKGGKCWQFLAFCFEWAGFRAHGYGYESHLPIQMDGTCNGLQNFSAMLLDEVGGAAVNLIPADQPQDIYQRVADRVAVRVEQDLDHTDEEIRMIARGWSGKVNRKVTKRPVMTLAYGAQRFGFVSQVESDTINPWRQSDPVGYPFIRSGDDGKAYDFGYKAAQYMGGLIWEVVGEVVVAARQAMEWLQASASQAGKLGLPVNWTTPTGFLVQQAYRVPDMKRIDTAFNSTRIQISYQVGQGKIDSRRQASGISPNWVHSLDASHLMKTICASVEEGISSFSMIHDSYGTHAGNAHALARILRDQFVQMYTQVDVLARFKEELEGQIDAELPALPPKGGLDLSVVRESAFFFA